MPNNFDLAGLALKSECPSNDLLFDDKGFPSAMVFIPKMTYAQLGLGTSTATFPAFLVNGSEVDGIWISKYLNVVNNGRGYSLPGVGPGNNMDFDEARSYCEAKGSGWHLMTALEWGALILWCEANGHIPLGNNNYGKHSSESNYVAIPDNKDASHYAYRTKTGTGPLTWSHDKTPSGIMDLCGNVWEWTGGIRLVKGEVQVLTNNNAADSDKSQGASSAEWKAIDATTGELITPNGSGTTSNSVKMDYQNSKLTYHTSITASQGGAGLDTEFNCEFKNITKSASVADAAALVLQALGMYPKASTSIPTNNVCYWRPFQDERCLFRGGNCSSTAGGFASFYAYNPRSYRGGHVGFRAAYIQLPAA